MKSKNPIRILIGWLAVFGYAPESHSQTNPPADSAVPAVATGTIEGRVQNVVTGQYLTNARITIPGTSRVAYTDQSGNYRLTQVGPGPIPLEIFYTGLDTAVISVNVEPDRVHRSDISMTNRSLYGQEPGVVKLDSFVVTTARVTDTATIAINEQRLAPNIKNVVAGDAFGDVLDGNVGEFLKFLPGVSAEYDYEAAGAVAAVSVRGFASNLTVVTADGAQMANPGAATGTSRSFHFGSISMNNVSRIELTKVPTPSTPADSMAGSVNMISKSAFERRRAEFNYSVSYSADAEFLDFSPQPSQSDQMRRKIRPGFSFDYTLPVNDKFGVVATGSYSERFVHTYDPYKTYNAAGTGTAASPSAPFMQWHRMIRHERFDVRSSLGLRADWRVMPNAVLTLGGQTSTFHPDRDPYDIRWDAGDNGTPTPATGSRMTYGPNFTHGATGRGNVTMQSTAGVDQWVDASGGNARFKFDDGNWRVDAGFNYSFAKMAFHDLRHRQFRQFGITMMNPVRVSFLDISPDALRPGAIRVFDNFDREVDITNVENWRLNTAQSTPRPTEDIHRGFDFSVRRSFDLLRTPVALQVGGLRGSHIRDLRLQTKSWTYNGPDGNPNTPDSPSLFLNSTFVGQSVDGLKNIPWVSRRKAFEEWQKNPALFTETEAQAVGNEQSRITGSRYLEETYTAGYLQAELRFLDNALKVVTGARYERTDAEGEGALFDPSAVFQRTVSGSFVRNAAGVRVRKPEAGAAGSFEELRLTRRERAYKASRTYDGYYPSLHLTYNIQKDLLGRFAYARTFGRPNFGEIIPNADVNESDIDADIADPSIPRGRISVTNPGLHPWTADNYDLSLEYYTPQGGLFSGGVFVKDIQDFFGTVTSLATAEDLEAIDLDPRYVGWELTRRINGGKARISGVEFNIMHSLTPLGAWGRRFQVFVAGSKLDLKGSNDADFRSFVKNTANWGVTYIRKPFTVRAKWNYRGDRRGAPVAALGTNGFEYEKARTRLDLNIDAQVWRRMHLFLNVNNVFDQPEIKERYAQETPGYARFYNRVDNGVAIVAGVKGSF